MKICASTQSTFPINYLWLACHQSIQIWCHCQDILHLINPENWRWCNFYVCVEDHHYFSIIWKEVPDLNGFAFVTKWKLSKVNSYFQLPVVKEGEYERETFLSWRWGVRQGCVMSHRLFNIYMVGVITEVTAGRMEEGSSVISIRKSWMMLMWLNDDDAILLAGEEEL